MPLFFFKEFLNSLTEKRIEKMNKKVLLVFAKKPMPILRSLLISLLKISTSLLENKKVVADYTVSWYRKPGIKKPIKESWQTMKDFIEIVVMNGILTEEEKTRVREYLENLELDTLISELEKTW